MTKYLGLKSILLLSIVVCLVSCEKPSIENQPIKPVLVMKVGNHSYGSQSMVLAGEVKTRYDANVSFRINGKINQRYVELGDKVKKGQVIARIDADDVQLSANAAGADVTAARANLALAQAELDRQKTLYQKKFISKSALDMREAEYKTAVARLKQTQSQYAVSNNQAQYTKLVADRAGVIAAINAEPGQVVAAGQTIAQIFDYDALEVLVAMPESRIQQISTGQLVSVKLWADRTKAYQGKVREIAPAANASTRAFDVRVSIVDADENFRLGMTAGVNFGDHHIPAITIPSKALTAINGEKMVWVIQEGVATARTVTAGHFTESGVEISRGLVDGELIAVAGVHTLVEGQQVKPQLVNTAK